MIMNFCILIKNISIANTEEKTFLNKNDSFDYENYIDEYLNFGTISFESNINIDKEDGYFLFEGRWQIEVIFKRSKSDLLLNETNVHSELAVLGEEFVNCIAITIQNRLDNQFRNL